MTIVDVLNSLAKSVLTSVAQYCKQYVEVNGTPTSQEEIMQCAQGLEATKVVRGMDLLLSTARQLLLIRALKSCCEQERLQGLEPLLLFPKAFKVPTYFHCPLVRDDDGVRMAKRYGSLTIKALREEGWTPQMIRDKYFTLTQDSVS